MIRLHCSYGMRHTFGGRTRISLLNSLNDVYGPFDTIVFAIRICTGTPTRRQQRHGSRDE